MRQQSHVAVYSIICFLVKSVLLLEECSSDYQCATAFSRCSKSDARCKCIDGFLSNSGKCQPENYKCPFGDPLQKDDSIHNCVLYRSLSAGPDRFDDTCPTGSYCQPFDDNLVGYTEGFCCPTPEVQCPIGSDQYKCDGETNCTCDPITNYFYGVEIINSVSRLCCAEPCPFGASSHDGICKFDTAGKSGQLTATFGVKCSGDTQCKPAYSQCAKGLCNCKKSFAQKQQKCLPKEFKCPKGLPLKDLVCTTSLVTTSTYLDSCPKGTFCLRSSLVSSEGRCCPELSLSCPVGNPDLEASCGGEAKGTQVCNSSSHFCYEAKIGGQIPTSICCPKPCVSQPNYSVSQHQQRIAIGSACRSQAKAMQKCSEDNECLQSNAVCEAGVCKCHPGLKNFNGTCLASDIETIEGVFLRKVSNSTVTQGVNSPSGPVSTTAAPGTVTTTPIKVVTSPTPTKSRNEVASGGDPDCINQHRCCKLWALKGECQTNTDYMNTYCSKSCGQCLGVDYPSCTDDDGLCLTWSKNGECLKNLDWMEENCPVSCKVCSRTKLELQELCAFKNGTRPVKECKNFYESCPVWTEKGECMRNPWWMSENCPLACGKCRQTT